MLKLNLQYFGLLMWRTDSLEKDPDSGKDWRQEEKATTGWDGWMASRLNGHEFEHALEVGDWQGSLVCHSSWDSKGQTWLSDWTFLLFCISILPFKTEYHRICNTVDTLSIFFCEVRYASSFDNRQVVSSYINNQNVSGLKVGNLSITSLPLQCLCVLRAKSFQVKSDSLYLEHGKY